MAVEPIIPPEWPLVYTLAVGQDWPEADEDALRRLAQYWTDALGQLVQLSGHGDDAAADVNYSVQAVSSDEFDQYWKKYTDGDQSVLGQLAQQCQILAEQLLQFAEQTEFTKISIDIQVVILLIQVLYDLVIAPLTGGLSMGEAFAAMFFTRTVVREILSKLIEAVILAMLPDVITQLVMMADGHRSGFDIGEALQAGQSGLIGGLVGLGAGKVLGGLGKGLENSLGKRIGGLVGAGITGAVTNVATNTALAGVTGIEDQIHASLDPAYAKQLQQQQQQGGGSGGNMLATIANGMFTGMLFHGLHEVTAKPTVTFHGPDSQFTGVKTGENTYTLFHDGVDNPKQGKLAGTGFIDDQGNLVVQPLVGGPTEHPVTGMSLTSHDITNHYSVGPDGTPELTHYDTTSKGEPLGLTLDGQDWTPPKGSRVTFDANDNPVQVVQTDGTKSTYYTTTADGGFQPSGWVEQPAKGTPSYFDGSGNKISQAEFQQNTDWTAQQPQQQQPSAQPQQPTVEQQQPTPQPQQTQQQPDSSQTSAPVAAQPQGESTPANASVTTATTTQPSDTPQVQSPVTTHLSDFTDPTPTPAENATRVLPETVAAVEPTPLLPLGEEPLLLPPPAEIRLIPEQAKSIQDQFPPQNVEKLPEPPIKVVSAAELDALSPLPAVGYRECGAEPDGTPRFESAIPGTAPWVLRIGDYPVDTWTTPIRPDAGAGLLLRTTSVDALAEGHGRLDAIVVEDPHSTVTDIVSLGEAVRPGGVIVLEGRTALSETAPSGGLPHGIPDRGPVWNEAAAGRVPPGYELVFHGDLTDPGGPVSRIVIRKVDPAAPHVDPSLPHGAGDPVPAAMRNPGLYVDSARRSPAEVVSSEEWQKQAKAFIRPYDHPKRPFHAGDFLSPLRIETECGIDQRAQQFFQGLADRDGIAITVRPSNPEAAPYLREGAPGKPPGLKMKTINVLDVGLGAPADKIGAVGYFRPEPPDYSIVPPELRSSLEKRYNERLVDYLDYHDSIEKLILLRMFRVADGVVYPFEPWLPSSRTADYEELIVGKGPYVDDTGVRHETAPVYSGLDEQGRMVGPVSGRPSVDPALGLPVVGDYDMFELRMADGRTMPWSEYDAFLRQGEAKVWYEKYVDESQMTFPQIYGKGRETGLILGRLRDVVQHGAAVNYTRDNPEADPTKMHRVVQKTLNQHLGPDGEPLVRFEPGKPPVLVFAQTPLRSAETPHVSETPLEAETTNASAHLADVSLPHATETPSQHPAPTEQHQSPGNEPQHRGGISEHPEEPPLQPLSDHAAPTDQALHADHGTLTKVSDSGDHMELRLDRPDGGPPIKVFLDRTRAGWTLSQEGTTNDLLRSYARQMEKVPGQFDIVAHATPEGFVIGDTVVPFKDVMDLIGGVPEDETLRLIACNAGGAEAATALAAELHRPVVAADREVWISPKGEVVASSRGDGPTPYPRRPPDGLWRVFHPDGSVEVPTAQDPRVPKPIPGWEVQLGAHSESRNLIAEALNGDRGEHLVGLGKLGFDPSAEPLRGLLLDEDRWREAKAVAEAMGAHLGPVTRLENVPLGDISRAPLDPGDPHNAFIEQAMRSGWISLLRRAGLVPENDGVFPSEMPPIDSYIQANASRADAETGSGQKNDPHVVVDAAASTTQMRHLSESWRQNPGDWAKKSYTRWADQLFSREYNRNQLEKTVNSQPEQRVTYLMEDFSKHGGGRSGTYEAVIRGLQKVLGKQPDLAAMTLGRGALAPETEHAVATAIHDLFVYRTPQEQARFLDDLRDALVTRTRSEAKGQEIRDKFHGFVLRLGDLVGRIEVARNPSALGNLMALDLAFRGRIHMHDAIDYFNIMRPARVAKLVKSAEYLADSMMPLARPKQPPEVLPPPPHVPDELREPFISTPGLTTPDVYSQTSIYRERQREVFVLYAMDVMDGMNPDSAEYQEYMNDKPLYIRRHAGFFVQHLLDTYTQPPEMDDPLLTELAAYASTLPSLGTP